MKFSKVWRTSSWLLGCASIAGMLACSSDEPGDDTSTTSGGADSGAGSNGGDTKVMVADITAGGAPIAESASTLVMRRLTYREYDHMLAVLLGDTSLPASGPSGWSPDQPEETGFITPDRVASYHVVQYNQTADALVDTALQKMVDGESTGKFVLPAGCEAPSAAEQTSCATQFITSFGLQTYRRPVADVERVSLLQLFDEVRATDSFSFQESIGMIAKAMLQSPNFLYHWEIVPNQPSPDADGLIPLTPWQIASRLATALWESMPDDELFAAAQNGELSTGPQILAQAQRMIADPRSAQSLYNFHLQWLFNMGFHVTDLSSVNPKPDTLLTATAAAGLQTEFTSFISSVFVPPGDGTLNTLYTAPYAFVNKDLAAIYGVTGPETGFEKVDLDPAQRGGIFTQVAFLAGIQETVADNPIYRGLAVFNKALCGKIPPPPPDVPPVNFQDGGTTRQSFDLHGSSACAKGCHQNFDPPGFAFGNYDGVGVYRTMDSGQPVDATGAFTSPTRESEFAFNNALELTRQMAESPEAQACVDRQWTRYILGRMETEADVGSLQAAFRSGASTPGFSMRDMLMSLLGSKAFTHRLPSDGEAL